MRRAGNNATYKLTEQDRTHVGMLAAMNLWPKQHIADAYGVTRKTVLVCQQRYLGEQDA